MKPHSDRSTLDLINRYTDQPGRMPSEVRSAIETTWGGRPVQLYAMADLDGSMRLTRTWVALGPDHVAIAPENNGQTKEGIRTFKRSQVKAVTETPGLSCTTLTLFGAMDDPPLAILRYTHRQRRAMGNVHFVVQQDLVGQTMVPREPDHVYAESLAQGIKEAQASVAKNQMTIVWRLLSYLKPYRREVTFGMVCASLMTMVSLVPPYLTGHLIDRVIQPFRSGQLSSAAASKMAAWMLGGIAFAYFFRQIFAWVRLRMMAVLGECVARDLRTHLYEHLQGLSVSYFSKKQTGSIISRVTSDTDRMWDFIAFGVVDVSLSALMLVGLGAVLLALDWRLGLILTLPVPILIYAIYCNGATMGRLYMRAWRKWSNLTDVLSDTIPGIRVVKAFNQETHEKKRFGRRNIAMANELFRIHESWTRFWPMLMLALNSITVLVWVFAMPRMLDNGSGGAAPLSAGTFVAFILYMGMYLQPIDVFGQMARMLNRATTSAHRIFELLDTEPQVFDAVEAVKLEPMRGRVTFENVSFTYDDVRQVLKGISFDVPAGEMIGLVGPSGGGKTTLINLMARFYDASGGRILIDGVDLRKLDAGHYRRQIGIVMQDPYLFHGTVVENIRYGLPEADLAQVIEAARAANAHDFICKLQHGYDSVVGERGHTLSGGERQRISIARAVLHNPRILILDEATSSVDTETERNIQQALERLVRGRTVFAIAHRLSTLTGANRLFVIKDGEMVEQGTHAELLARKDGIYRKLHDLQRELHEMYAF